MYSCYLQKELSCQTYLYPYQQWARFIDFLVGRWAVAKEMDKAVCNKAIYD